MKKIIYISAAFIFLSAVSCTQFDDSAIWDNIENHEQRIQNLEKTCSKLNADIIAQQSVLKALQTNDYVTAVAETVENGSVIGYTIRFTSGNTININHGKHGSNGQNGVDGLPGADGSDGADGHTPVIGVRRDTDGKYYWTLDGEWLSDADGSKIPVCGPDGADGTDGLPGADGSDGLPGIDGIPGVDGANGSDGVTPLLKIEDDYWYVSHDNGVTWNQLYVACSEDGIDGESFFKSVDVSDPNYVVFTLADGQQIKLPTWEVFEILQRFVNQMNTNITSLRQIINSLQSNDFVTEIRPIVENGVEVGYTIYFSKSLPVTIYHGEDGKDGADGKDGIDGVDGADGKDGVDGADGKDGKDGADGHVPVIDMLKGDDGQYYWTIDGEFLLDNDGNKILATGRDGKDGVIPQLKVENGYWYISYDCGATWEKEPLGKASELYGKVTFAEITYDDDYVYITLVSGTEIKLPRDKQKLEDCFSYNPISVIGNTAVITGRLEILDSNQPYSQVTVYYSQASEEFNIHTALRAQTSFYGDNNQFTVTINDLKYASSYNYCIGAKVQSEEIFTSVEQIAIQEFGHGCSIDLAYENGKFTGSGYYYATTTSSIVNGHAAPVLKSRMPDHIDGVQFYVKGEDNYTQPLTAFVGYLTDSTKVKTLKIFKSFTHEVQMTTSYSKVIIPLHLTRQELAEVPDNGVLYVGYYPPEGHNQKPIGCGYTKKTEQGYIETEGHLGLYTYYAVKSKKYVWAISSQKNPRYAGFITLINEEGASTL